jgi:nitroreductase
MSNSKVSDEELSPLRFYEPGMNWNPVEKVILERRSNRVFKKDPLPDSMIRRILEAARFAPSAGNFQPWKFLVIKSPEILAKMEADARKKAIFFMRILDYTKSKFRRIFLKPIVKLIIRLMHNLLAPPVFYAMMMIAEGKLPTFHNAPVIILILYDKRGPGDPLVDAAIAGENIVLSAHSLGAGTCWTDFIKLLLHAPRARKWKKLFGIQYPYKLLNCICLGWPKGNWDGMVPREVQPVYWYEGSLKDKPRIEKQGE